MIDEGGNVDWADIASGASVIQKPGPEVHSARATECLSRALSQKAFSAADSCADSQSFLFRGRCHAARLLNQ